MDAGAVGGWPRAGIDPELPPAPPEGHLQALRPRGLEAAGLRGHLGARARAHQGLRGEPLHRRRVALAAHRPTGQAALHLRPGGPGRQPEPRRDPVRELHHGLRKGPGVGLRHRAEGGLERG